MHHENRKRARQLHAEIPSETESSEFCVAPEKPSDAAVMPRSMGYVVPASAAAPNGQTFMCATALLSRLPSRSSMNRKRESSARR